MKVLLRNKDNGQLEPKEMDPRDIEKWFKDHTNEKGEVEEEIIQFTDAEIKAAKDGEHEWVMSDYSIDRDYERIDPDGWDLKEFKKNPVLLWAHNIWQPAIGRVKSPKKKNGQLVGTVVLDPPEVDPFAGMIEQKIQRGTISAGSVGFRVLEMEFPEEGEGGKGKKPQVRMISRKQELYEFSICNVPANPAALILRGQPEEIGKKVTEVTLSGFFAPENQGVMKLPDEYIIPRSVLENVQKELQDDAIATGEEREETAEENEENTTEVLTKSGEIEESGGVGEEQTTEAVSGVKEEEKIAQNEDSEKIEESEKKVIPYADHGKAPESAPWDAGKERRAASVQDLKVMCTWYDSENADVKGSYKLPHHHQGDKKAVWRGVAAAMGALLGARGGTQIPAGDRRGVYNHLVKHYKQFDKEPPEFKGIGTLIFERLDDIEKMLGELMPKQDREVNYIRDFFGSDKESRETNGGNGQEAKNGDRETSDPEAKDETSPIASLFRAAEKESE